jgi:hypothetical protein
MNFEELKALHRERRDHFEEGFSTRVHRALSWLQRAEKETEDDDASFIFLWIAFNASYTSETHAKEGVIDKNLMTNYFRKLVNHGKHDISKLLNNGNRTLILEILENEYIIKPFWNDEKGQEFWKYIRAKERRDVVDLIGYEDRIGQILTILFGRFYVLRNQLLHGGSTWNSSVNRKQVQDCNQLLKVLVPLFIKIMLDSPKDDWGDITFPVKK